jgi:hypothetical protein
MKTLQDVLDAVVAKSPMALVSLDEISEALALPPIEAIPLIVGAEQERLIDVWRWKGQTLHCCLSADEAERRSLALTAPDRSNVEPADWRWMPSGGPAGAVGRRAMTRKELAQGRGKAMGGILSHSLGSDDPIADEDRGPEAVADLPRRIPPKRKHIKWRWTPPMTDDEVRAYLRQFTIRPAPRRRFSGTRSYHPPGILLGLAHPQWTPDCERGTPCPICGDRPLSRIEACLGCGRTSDLLHLAIGLSSGRRSKSDKGTRIRLNSQANSHG